MVCVRCWAAWAAVLVLALHSGCSSNPSDSSNSKGSSVASPEAKEAKTVAAKEEKKEVTPASDIAYVRPEHYCAVVFRPRRIVELPAVAAQLKDEMVLETVKKFPFDPADVEQFTLLFQIPEKGAIPFTFAPPTVVLHFVQPIEAKKTVTELARWMRRSAGDAPRKSAPGSLHAKDSQPSTPPEVSEIQCAGKTCYQFPDGSDVLAYSPNPTTLVITVKPTMEKILAGEAPKGPLVDRLKKADADNDIFAALALECYPDLPASIDQHRSKDYDPDVFEEVSIEVIKSLAGGTATVNLKGDMLLQMSLDAPNAAGAELLEDLTKAFAKFADGGLLLFKKGAPAEIQAKYGPAMLRGAEAFAETKVTRTGTQVTVSVKRPAKADEAFASLGEAFKDNTAELRREEEDRRLRAIAAAIRTYEEHNGSLPPHAIEKNGKPLLSWRVAILPQLDELELYQQFHLDELWDSPHNLEVARKIPQVFQSVGSEANGKTRVIVFTGKGSVFDPDRKVRLSELRGYPLSQTILCAEAGPDKAEFWTRPNDTPFDPENPAAVLGQVPRTGFNACIVDGYARQVRINSSSLKKMVLPFAANTAERRPGTTGTSPAMKTDYNKPVDVKSGYKTEAKPESYKAEPKPEPPKVDEKKAEPAGPFDEKAEEKK
jgi:hypothetical protein